VCAIFSTPLWVGVRGVEGGTENREVRSIRATAKEKAAYIEKNLLRLNKKFLMSLDIPQNAIQELHQIWLSQTKQLYNSFFLKHTDVLKQRQWE
jgi:hypothetical protein